jgi:hypothetical protein
MESSYLTQVHVQAANEAALVNTVGFEPSAAEHDLRPEQRARGELSDERSRWPRKCARPSSSRSSGNSGASAINGWAGGIDTYQDIYDEVRNNPHTLAENVEPRRWWKA